MMILTEQRKTVLITGASSGFGKACVHEFLANGWQVIATMRMTGERETLFEAHPLLTVHELDVTNPDHRLQLAALLNDKFAEKLDCLVNNAGYGLMGVLESLPEEEIKSQIDVNFFGLTLLIKSTLPYLRKAHGRIINISSVLGYSGFPLASLYCASKYAVEGLSESLYYELAPHGVQVALVQPGRHATEFGNNLKKFNPDSLQNSLYQLQMKNYFQLLNNKKLQISGSSEKVAKIIHRLAISKKMPLKTHVGFDASLTYWARKLLPTCISYRLFQTIYTKILTRDIPA